jgi:hypothetical protein
MYSHHLGRLLAAALEDEVGRGVRHPRPKRARRRERVAARRLGDGDLRTSR